MLAALAKGTSRLEHFSAAADCQSTLDCLKRLGVKIERTDSAVRITGAGLRGLQHSRRKLDAENSGTTMRMLTGILAGQQFDSTLSGDASLRRRPMRRVIDPLTQMGAEIHAGHEGVAPLKILGRKLAGIDYTMPVSSASSV